MRRVTPTPMILPSPSRCRREPRAEAARRRAVSRAWETRCERTGGGIRAAAVAVGVARQRAPDLFQRNADADIRRLDVHERAAWHSGFGVWRTDGEDPFLQWRRAKRQRHDGTGTNERAAIGNAGSGD